MKWLCITIIIFFVQGQQTPKQVNRNSETMSITSHHFIDKFFFGISNEGGLTLESKILVCKQSEMAFTNSTLLSLGCDMCMHHCCYYIPKRGKE